jgi:hypothetical protein
MVRATIMVVGLATIWLTACAPSAPDPLIVSAADLDFCRSEITRYRAMVPRSALEQSPLLDQYAAAAAEYDGVRHAAHAYSNDTRPSPSLLRFENEIPWWPVARSGSVRAIIREGIAAMWAEGPSGAHYQAMTNATVTQMGCGAYVGNSEVTVVQAFR